MEEVRKGQERGSLRGSRGTSTIVCRLAGAEDDHQGHQGGGEDQEAGHQQTTQGPQQLPLQLGLQHRQTPVAVHHQVSRVSEGQHARAAARRLPGEQERTTD